MSTIPEVLVSNPLTTLGGDEAFPGTDDPGGGGEADFVITSNNLASSIKTLASLLAALSEDTTPQLGGNLDLNSNDITGTGDINHTGALTTSGAADVGSLQARASVINAETASFTFALDDAGKLTTISNAGSTTATIPPNSSVPFPVGTMLYLAQIGAGACTWTEGAGVTINVNSNFADPAVTNGQYSYSFARKTATDTWEVGGQIVPLNPIRDEFIPIGALDSDATAASNKNFWDIPRDGTLVGIGAGAFVAPTGSAAGIDANLQTTAGSGGATIMDTNKLNIADGAYQDDGTATLSTTAVSAGDRILFDQDSIGSSTAGRGYYVQIIWRPS